MDATGIAILLGLFACVIPIVVGWRLWQRRWARQIQAWPQVTGTVESGGLEAVDHDDFMEVKLPTFAFSYEVDGEFYSGRFALLPYITDPGQGIIAQMIGRKIQIHYDPQRPATWLIADDLIEGCKVEQKRRPHWFHFYPQD